MKLFICAIILMFTGPAWGQFVDPYVQPINPYQFAPLTPVIPMPYTGPSVAERIQQQQMNQQYQQEQRRANQQILQELRRANRDHERYHQRLKRF